jgi:hypothetical protein
LGLWKCIEFEVRTEEILVLQFGHDQGTVELFTLRLRSCGARRPLDLIVAVRKESIPK